MTTRPTKVPAIPSPTSDNLLEVAKAVKGLLDIREGLIGDPRDAFVTRREASGNATLQLSLLGRPGGGGSSPGDPEDTTPPPAPTSLAATGAFAIIVLQWNLPTPPHNVAYTEIWRSSTNVLGNAVLIGTSRGRLYTDSVGTTASFYYWVRFVTYADVSGPYNSTDGTLGTTGQDPQVVLDVLNGALRESHLYRGLAEPISSIVPGQDDAASSSLVSLIESRRRLSAVGGDLFDRTSRLETGIYTLERIVVSGDAQSAQRVVTLAAVVEDNDRRITAALQEEAFVRAEETGDLFGKYTIKVDLNGYVTGYGLASTVNNGVPTSEFIVVADKFSIAPVATSPGAADGSPFFVITTPTTIDGVTVQPGAYLKNAFIADATIGTAKIRDLRADKITAGFTTAVHLQNSKFIGSEFYIGGTPVFSFVPGEPTIPQAIESVVGWSARLTQEAAQFNVDRFQIFNGTTFEVPFEVSGGVVRAKRADIQDLQVTSQKIANLIQSNDFNGTYLPGGPSPDPHFGSTTLILNFDAGTALDQSPSSNSPSSQGGISYLTAGGMLAGAGSLVSSAAGQWIYSASTDFNHRSVYTLEFRIRWTPGGAQGFFMARSATQYFALTSDGNISVTGYGSSLTAALTNGANHHIELCSDGTTLRLFRDGVLVDSGAPSAPNLAAQQFALLGVPLRPDLAGPTCVIDSFRLTQDVARHTTNFTPPSGPLPGGPTAGGFTSFGTAGWAISREGQIVTNNIYARGALATGGFSPESWAWPAAGQNGSWIGPSGLRLGREASGQFFEVSNLGVLRAPGLTISGGSADFSGSLSGATGTFSGSLTSPVITTENIIGAQITTGYTASTVGTTLGVGAIVPPGSSMLLIIAHLGDPFFTTGGSGKDTYTYQDTPTGTLQINAGPILVTQKGVLVYGLQNPPSGTLTCFIARNAASGVLNISVLVTKR